MVVTGTFEEIFELMFGPQQHDAHVRCRRSWQFVAPRISDFDARMAEMTAYAMELARA